VGATTALLPGLAGWMLAVATAAADVTPPDGREPPTAAEQAMLTGIGVIYPDGSLGGTAFLVGRCDVLATARHTVLDASDRPRADRFLYYPLNGDRAIEVPLEGSIVGSGGGEQDDWIVMRLAEPDTGCRPMIAWAVADGDLMAVADEGFDNAGFHADLRGELRVSHGCTIAPACRAAAEDGDVFTHDCDTDVGASGSPIYVAAPEGIAVFGMHIRGHGHGADICSQSNLALRISGAFHAAIREMLTAEVPAGLRRHHD
jgi:hypothetical protein